VIGLLLDEMFPVEAAIRLREEHGCDAVHVAEIGLLATADDQIATHARSDGRAVVTENVVDFAAEVDTVLVFVLKKNLPAGKGQAAALAAVLDRWVRANDNPYRGHHWPDI
jgi:Domain of unknown function (DUF5615)